MFKVLSGVCLTHGLSKGSIRSNRFNMAHRLSYLWAFIPIGFLIAMGWGGSLSCAFAAPGEDPITLRSRIGSPMGPALAAPRSTPMSPPAITPAWLEAKVARLEAKAWAFDTGNLVTDRNVVAASAVDGVRKVCIQDVGSITAGANNNAGAAMLKNQEPQIVVLRGDLVNICK